MSGIIIFESLESSSVVSMTWDETTKPSIIDQPSGTIEVDQNGSNLRYRALSSVRHRDKSHATL